jgi:hypothetical protein
VFSEKEKQPKEQENGQSKETAENALFPNAIQHTAILEKSKKP